MDADAIGKDTVHLDRDEAIFLKAVYPAFKNFYLGELCDLSPALRIPECRAGGSNPLQGLYRLPCAGIFVFLAYSPRGTILGGRMNQADNRAGKRPSSPEETKGLSPKTVTVLVYALQAASFAVGITLIIGVILNYIKREDVRGTWLESHFRWQIRTFWYSVLWTVIGVLTAIVLIGYAVLFANAVWVIYRIIKGWIRLSEGMEMYPRG